MGGAPYNREQTRDKVSRMDKPVICGRPAELDPDSTCPTCSYRYYKCIPCNGSWDATVPDRWKPSKPSKDPLILSNDGPECPGCGRPAQVRQRGFSPYGYCTHEDCHVKAIHGEEYKDWGREPF